MYGTRKLPSFVIPHASGSYEDFLHISAESVQFFSAGGCAEGCRKGDAGVFFWRSETEWYASDSLACGRLPGEDQRKDLYGGVSDHFEGYQ